jgi:N-acetylglucosaminyl-diphospho-decaprenol L-rhamnosyltransferase
VPDLTIIIVNRNCAGMLGDCLRSIRSSSRGLGVEMIIVDNASVDESVNVARTEWPQATLLLQNPGIGYVRANNLGLKHATGRHTMFLNNDTIVRTDALQRLVSFLDEHPEAGIVSPKILNPDGTDQGTARRFPSVANGLFGRRSYLSRRFPRNRWTRRYMLGRQHQGLDPLEVEIVSSGCLMIRTSLAKELNGMDESFQLYWVDAELCARVRRRGLKVFSVPGAEIVHFEGQGGSTKTWRERWRSTFAFHEDAYHAYVKVHQLSPLHPVSCAVGGLLAARMAMMMALQIVRPGKATSSGGKN